MATLTPLGAAVLAAILAGPIRGDRSYVLPELAQAIADVSATPEAAAALVAVARHESFFAAYVLEGRCSDGPPGERCDPDRSGEPQALGPWQLHAWCSIAWLRGWRSYREQAMCAWGRLRWGRRLCGSWSGALNIYGGRECRSSWSAKRDASRRAALATIRRELARSESE